MELKGKTAVITGGSHGLGKALAEVLRKEGAQVVISSHSKEKLAEAAMKTGSFAIMADVRKETDIALLARKAKSRFGKIDLWINNAGVWIPQKSITKTDWRAAHNLFEINFFGTVYGSKHALLHMMKISRG